MSAPDYKALYEELRDELVRTNQKLANREQSAVTFLRGRSAALVALGDARGIARREKERADKAERERDAARVELRRVCSGAGFKILDDEPS